MSAALLAKLIEAGTPAALVAEVALELGRAEAMSTALEQRRKHERERKARSREVTGQGVTERDSADKVSLDKKPPQTPEKIKPIPCVREPRARLGYHRLPEGWRPAKPFPAPLQAKLDQWPPGKLADEIAAFKRWAANAENKDGKGRKLDWDKALWNWLGRQHDERHSRPAGNITSLRGSRPDPALDLLRAARAAEDREADLGARAALPAIGSS